MNGKDTFCNADTLRAIYLIAFVSLVSSSPTSTNQVSVLFGGDVSFDGPVRYNANRSMCPYEKNFETLKTEFRNADHVMVNLESSVSRDRNLTVVKPSGIRLLAEPKSLDALKAVGVDLVTIANNHFSDLGDPAALETVQALRDRRIQYAGLTRGKSKDTSQKPIIIEDNGIRIGILAYCDNDEGCGDLRSKVNIGPAVMSVDRVKDDVAKLRKSVDVVVVYMHWDVELASVPDSGRTVYAAIKLAGIGIDLLIGSHPHVTQGHWYHGSMLVIFSLGNLMFPMTLANALNFMFDYKDKNATPENELKWFKMEKRQHNPTKNGKLAKIFFDKRGVVREKSVYLRYTIKVSADHCLQPTPNGNWTEICGSDDGDCLGVYRSDENVGDLMGVNQLIPERQSYAPAPKVRR